MFSDSVINNYETKFFIALNNNYSIDNARIYVINIIRMAQIAEQLEGLITSPKSVKDPVKDNETLKRINKRLEGFEKNTNYTPTHVLSYEDTNYDITNKIYEIDTSKNYYIEQNKFSYLMELQKKNKDHEKEEFPLLNIKELESITSINNSSNNIFMNDKDSSLIRTAMIKHGLLLDNLPKDHMNKLKQLIEFESRINHNIKQNSNNDFSLVTLVNNSEKQEIINNNILDIKNALNTYNFLKSGDIKNINDEPLADVFNNIIESSLLNIKNSFNESLELKKDELRALHIYKKNQI